MKIEKIKKIGNKYKIILDDDTNITTYDDVIINRRLLYKKELDELSLNEINNETSYYETYYKTIKFITRKLRSEKEVNEFLDKLNVELSLKKDIINKLKDIGLINDLAFTKAYIMDSINLSNKGLEKIKKELLNHDINENIIEEEINKIDYNLIYNKITKLINKKIKTSKYTGIVLKQKVINDLINLGYLKEDVLNVYDKIGFDNSAIIKKEYDKLYKKLSVKYSDKELYQKLKTKLYQKGFSIDEINSVIEID